MVIGLSGVQFGLYSYKSLTKSDERKAQLQFPAKVKVSFEEELLQIIFILTS